MRGVLKIGWCCVLICSWIGQGFSQGLFESEEPSLSLGGFIRSALYTGRTPENENLYLQSAYAQIGLTVDAKAGKWATGKAEVRFRYGTEFQESISQPEIREAYVDLTAGPAGLRMGKLISPWGRSTLFNPTGKMTPIDPTVRSPEEDDIYQGIWAMQGRMNLGPSMKVAATWKPFYQPSVLLIDPVPMPEYVHFLEPDFPGLELKRGSYGIRYDIYTRIADGSLYWFDGYHHWPGLGFDSIALSIQTMSPEFLNLRETAYGIRMLGLDFSVPLGSWILRAEGAWQQSKESPSENEYVPYPELSYNAELERTGSNLTLLAGYNGKYILDYDAPLAEASLSADPEQFIQLFQEGFQFTAESIDRMILDRVSAFNRLYNYQIEEFYHTVFAVGRLNLWHNQFELILPVVYNITTEEWIFRPAISWLTGDGMEVTAGFNAFYGPENSLYDMIGPVLNAGFLSMKITF